MEKDTRKSQITDIMAMERWEQWVTGSYSTQTQTPNYSLLLFENEKRSSEEQDALMQNEMNVNMGFNVMFCDKILIQ